MNAMVKKALDLWGMTDAQYSLVAARENAVYKVSSSKGTFAIRLHRQGYRTNQELWSELKWMEAASSGGISVPIPISSTSNEVLHIIDDIQVDILSWLSGSTMDQALKISDEPTRAKLFHSLGQQMARLHMVSDAWTQPEGFTRCKWDRDGLVGEQPLWDRFWDNPGLSDEEKALFSNIRLKAVSELTAMESTLDYGLIHADLVCANVMVSGDKLHLIDFDDGGFGFRLFEIATALLKNLVEPDYPALRHALINGYTSIRNIDLAALDLFLILRAATYVGWNITRINEDGAAARNQRFINTTKQLAQDYLAL